MKEKRKRGLKKLIEVLPDVGISKIIGFLEVLHDSKGVAETVQLAMDLNLELDAFLPVLEAAELLDFVKVKSGRVQLTKTGKDLVEKTLSARREVLKKQLLEVNAFSKTIKLLRSKAGKRMKLKTLLKHFKASLSEEEALKTAQRVIDWGRHAEVLGYDSSKEEVYLL